MREIRQTVYTVSELSDGAKAEAYHNWLQGWDYHRADDNEASLKAFADVFPVSVGDWEYGGYSRPYIQWDFTEDDDIKALEGQRLATYIYNNYWTFITKGRYYSLWSKKDKNPYYREGGHAPYGDLKTRYSRVLIETEGACPFTGYYMDNVLLSPIFEFLKKPVAHMDFEDLLELCLDGWVDACNSDREESSSMEAFEEQAEANGYEYYENGECYYK